MTDTEQTNAFVVQLQTDTAKYTDASAREEYLAEVRETAAEHFLTELLSGPLSSKKFEENAMHRNKLGQQTVRLTQWQGRGPVQLDQSLSDLLDLGDLLQRMQDHLDSTYGSGEFRVFNHLVKGNRARGRMISLTVSWNKERFENVDEIITNNRERALDRQKRQQEDRTSGGGGDEVEEDQGQTQGRHGGRYEDRRGGGRRDGGGRYDSGRRDGGQNRHDDRRRDQGHGGYSGHGGGGGRYEDRDDRRSYNDDNRRPADRGEFENGGGRPSRRRAAVSSYGN